MKEKILRVINSCNDIKQYACTEKYVQLALDKLSDIDSREIYTKLLAKRYELMHVKGIHYD